MAKKTARRRPSIPHDIIYDIFSRLPVKSLLRFKCINKSCNSLISDSEFVDFHRHRFVETKTFVWAGRDIYTLEKKGDKKATFLQTHRFAEICNGGAFHCSGCVNGLICFWSLGEQRVAIFNPYRREVKYLPTLNEYLLQCSFSLGFEPQENKYKVVLTALHFENKYYYMKNWIFTIGMDKSWREIQRSFPDEDKHRAGVSISGIIYKLLHKPDAIGAFDLKSETFKVLELWNASDHDTSNYYLAEVNGKLGIMDFKWKRTSRFVDLWILEKTSWQHHTIQFVPSIYKHLNFDFSVSSDREIFFFRENLFGSLWCFDVMKKSWRKIEMEGLPKEKKISGIYCCTESLVLPSST